MAECEDLDLEVLGALFDEEFTEINASTTTDEALREMGTALQEPNSVIAPSHDPKFPKTIPIPHRGRLALTTREQNKPNKQRKLLMGCKCISGYAKYETEH